MRRSRGLGPARDRSARAGEQGPAGRSEGGAAVAADTRRAVVRFNSGATCRCQGPRSRETATRGTGNRRRRPPARRSHERSSARRGRARLPACRQSGSRAARGRPPAAASRPANAAPARGRRVGVRAWPRPRRRTPASRRASGEASVKPSACLPRPASSTWDGAHQLAARSPLARARSAHASKVELDNRPMFPGRCRAGTGGSPCRAPPRPRG